MTIFIKNILIDDRQLIYIIIFHIFLILNPIIDIFKINDIINQKEDDVMVPTIKFREMTLQENIDIIKWAFCS